MPYIEQDFRDKIKQTLQNIQTVGDLNYAITQVILATWLAQPRYATIHELRKAYVTEPKHNVFLNHLRYVLCDKFSVADVYTASAEAFWEFRDRVGKIYEAKKCVLNGDLPEYIEAVTTQMKELLEAKDKMKPKTDSLILPGQEKK